MQRYDLIRFSEKNCMKLRKCSSLSSGGGDEGGTSILFCQIFREKSENENGGGGAMGTPRSTTVFSTEFQPVIRTQYNNRSKIDVP